METKELQAWCITYDINKLVFIANLRRKKKSLTIDLCTKRFPISKYNPLIMAQNIHCWTKYTYMYMT